MLSPCCPFIFCSLELSWQSAVFALLHQYRASHSHPMPAKPVLCVDRMKTHRSIFDYCTVCWFLFFFFCFFCFRLLFVVFVVFCLAFFFVVLLSIALLIYSSCFIYPRVFLSLLVVFSLATFHGIFPAPKSTGHFTQPRSRLCFRCLY
jgi:hypothetical protein